MYIKWPTLPNLIIFFTCMNMKLLLILSLFGSVFSTDDISPYSDIDYSRCQWLYGSATDKMDCPARYVGVGACGNKGQNRCGPNGKAHGIECCEIKSGGNLLFYSCQSSVLWKSVLLNDFAKLYCYVIHCYPMFYVCIICLSASDINLWLPNFWSDTVSP